MPESMSSRLDMTGRRISSSSTIATAETCSAKDFQSILELFPRVHSNTGMRCSSSERSMRSKITTTTSALSVESTIDVEDTSISSSIHNDALEEASSLTTKPSESDKKLVRFRFVYLREYGLCLGDNPSVARGAPLALDWDVKTEFKYSIDAFEESEHCAAKLQPTAGLSLKRPSLERLHVLKNLGYSRKEIKEATDEAQRIKEQRIKTRRQVERGDRLRQFFDAILCFFRSPNDCCDPNEVLSQSISTVSTRNSSIDWSAIGTDVSQASPSRPRKNATKGNRGRRRMQQIKEEWHAQLQLHWEQQKWLGYSKRKPRDSLDIARHPKTIHSLELLACHPPVKLEKEATPSSIDNV